MQFDGEELYRVLDQSRKLQEQVAVLQEQLAELRGEGLAADGLVRLTVTAGGAIDSLQFDPRVMRMDSMSLAEAVQAAHRAAVEDLQAKVQELNATVFGDEVADLINGSTSVESMIGDLQAKTEQGLDQSLAEIDRLRQHLPR